jgi:hypothetical protein
MLSTIKPAPIARDRRINLPGLTSNNTVAYVDDSGAQCVRLHNTLVAKRAPDGAITLDSGGFRTVTTKRRINEALRAWRSDWVVYQRKGEWLAKERYPGGVCPLEFIDGMVLS